MLNLPAIFDEEPLQRQGNQVAADPAITANDLPEYWREHYEERAAIREYDGGQVREHAEAEALRETIEAMQKQNGPGA